MKAFGLIGISALQRVAKKTFCSKNVNVEYSNGKVYVATGGNKN